MKAKAQRHSKAEEKEFKQTALEAVKTAKQSRQAAGSGTRTPQPKSPQPARQRAAETVAASAHGLPDSPHLQEMSPAWRAFYAQIGGKFRRRET